MTNNIFYDNQAKQRNNDIELVATKAIIDSTLVNHLNTTTNTELVYFFNKISEETFNGFEFRKEPLISTNIIRGIPLFVDDNNGDYRLTKDSPTPDGIGVLFGDENIYQSEQLIFAAVNTNKKKCHWY